MITKKADLFGRKGEVAEVVDRLLQAGGHQVIAAGRQPPHPQLEGDPLVGHAVDVVAGCHGQLVQVREQPQVPLVGKQRHGLVPGVVGLRTHGVCLPGAAVR